VRYGSRTFGEDALRVLAPRHALVMDALSRAERADNPEDGEEEEAAR
jgi:SpoU rRNA methylase family enzyme